MSKSMPIAVGIVGTGRMAATMIAAARSVPGVRIAAIASTSGNRERAARLAGSFGLEGCERRFPELIKASDIDLVYVANATELHAATAVAALRAGKHVLCEKPFATSPVEGRAVIEAARQSGTMFMEAQWTSFLPAWRRALALVREGAIGEAASLTASFGYPVARTSDPALFGSRGGGVLLDRAVYPVALAVQLFGPARSVATSVRRSGDGVDVEASFQIEHKTGGTSQLAVSLTALLANQAVVCGPGGSITIEAPLVGAEEVTVRTSKPAAAARKTCAQAGLKDRLRSVPRLRRLNRMLDHGRRAFLPYGGNPYSLELEHAADLIAAGRNESDIVPHALSLEVVRIVDAARVAEEAQAQPLRLAAGALQ